MARLKMFRIGKITKQVESCGLQAARRLAPPGRGRDTGTDHDMDDAPHRTPTKMRRILSKGTVAAREAPESW